MSAAVLRVMLLGLLRDRGALVMSFLVPAAFFLIFASITSATSGEDLRLSVVIADTAQNERSRALIGALAEEPGIDRIGPAEASPLTVRDWVRRARADVGLIVRPAPAEAMQSGEAALTFLVIADPARGVAARILSGQVQKVFFTGLLGLEEADAADTEAAQRAALVPAVEREDVTGGAGSRGDTAYYAGAVAVLFLLLAAVHGAVTVLEEHESGILDRIVVGPGSTGVLVNGKFLYLVLQGFVQVGVIFVVAWLVHGVDLPRHWLGWSIVTLAASAAAAGLALAITTACTTRRQAHSVATVIVLILSALGGSMVPRFLMPPFMQDLGWLTPNTWALEAYLDLFWREEPLAALVLPLAVLLGAAVIGLAAAQLFARRLQSL